MRNVYIDVSLLLQNSAITGIQRVVKNVTLELLKTNGFNVHLISYNQETKKYILIDRDKFISHLTSMSLTNKMNLIKGDEIDICNIEENAIFFDIDSVWCSSIMRSWLYPVLKKQGVRIVTYVYDIVPILYPDYCDVITVNLFMGYIGATLMYSDYIITSTKTVLDEVNELAKQLEIQCPDGGYSWLGSDFRNIEAKINGDIKEKLKDKKYILCVGTIEPRKNISFLLDAFDEELFNEGLSLVLVGGKGWKTEDLINRIENHKQIGKNLFFLRGIDDAGVQYLYNNAIAVAFPTFDEGFGLPIVEAFERSVPVLTSDRPVLREVGGELAEYFTLDNTAEFIELVKKYSDNIEYRNEKINKIKEEYERVTWEDVARKIGSLLEKVPNTNKNINKRFIFDDIGNNYLQYAEEYKLKYGEYPVISIDLKDGIEIRYPRYIKRNIGLLKIPVILSGILEGRPKINETEITERESFIKIDTDSDEAICLNVKYLEEHKEVEIV